MSYYDTASSVAGNNASTPVVKKSAFLPQTSSFNWRQPLGQSNALTSSKPKIAEIPGLQSSDTTVYDNTADSFTNPESNIVKGTYKGDGDEGGGFFSGLGTDGESLQGYAQLGGLAMQLMGYSNQKKIQEAQLGGLQETVKQAKIDNAARNANRKALATSMVNNTGVA